MIMGNAPLNKARNFVSHDIWAFHADEMPAWKSAPLRLLRVMVMAVRDFSLDQCKIRASALTFFSILSVVPVVALIFGIAKGFGLEIMFKDNLLEKFDQPSQQEIILQIFDYAEKMLHSAKGGIIAGIGVILLFYSAIKLFSSIESSFNHIWQVAKDRSFWTKFRDYTIIIIAAVFAIILSSSLTVIITTRLNTLASEYQFLNVSAAPLVFLIIKIVPYALMALFFSVFYKFMPNTKVNYGAAIVAGILTGTVFQLVQDFFIFTQVWLSKSNAIYGSLSALPLFFLWTQLTWIIVLFGAEVSFAYQNSDNFEFEPYTSLVSHNSFQIYAVRAAAMLVHNFCSGMPAGELRDIARACRMPLSLTRKVLDSLISTGVAAETIDPANPGRTTFQPLCNAAELSVSELVSRIDRVGISRIERHDEHFEPLAAIVNKAISGKGSNPTLKQLPRPGTPSDGTV